MNIAKGSGVVRGLVALVALASVASACGTEGDGQTATETVSTSSELLSNVAYPGLTAQNGTAGDATIFNGSAYMAFIQTNGNVGIIKDSNLGSGGQTASWIPLNAPAVYGAALLALNNTLYVFYIGSANGALYMRRSTDGLNFNDGPWLLATPPETNWTSPPTAVAWDGNPVVFIDSGSGSIRSCIFQYNVSGTSASLHTTQNGNGIVCSNARPSATIWQGGLYLAYADNGQSGQINIQHWTDANGWSLWQPTGKYGIPGIYPVGAGALEMVYRNNSDSHIYRMFSTDGKTFGTSYEDTASTTNHAPVPFSNWNLSSNWTFYVGVNNMLFTVLE
jgi:hypothetical protein